MLDYFDRAKGGFAKKQPTVDALRNAQRALVTASSKCWSKPADLEALLWLQVYVETPLHVKAEMMGQEQDDGITVDDVLHSECGWALGQDEVDAIYAPFLSFLTRESPPMLTAVLNSPAAPPIARFWVNGDGLASDWLGLEMEPYRYYANEYLFGNGRAQGELIHLSVRGRYGQFSKYIGAAGAYLFSQGRGLALPTCFLAQLQALTRRLLNAQLAAVSHNLLTDYKKLAEEFAVSRGHLASLTRAAEEAEKRIDILARDVETSHLEAARKKARDVVELKLGVPPKDVCHSYQNLLENLPQWRHFVVSRLASLRDALSAACPFTRLLGAAFPTGLDSQGDIEAAWFLGRALYKAAFPLQLLDASRMPWEAMGPLSGTALDQQYKAPKDRERVVDSRLQLAVVQLASWKSAGAYGLSIDSLRTQNSRGIEVTLSALKVAHTSDLRPVVDGALGYIDQERGRLGLGGNASREWARVIRGLAGSGAAEPKVDGNNAWIAFKTLDVRR